MPAPPPLLAALAAASAPLIQPGYWEAVSEMLSPIPSRKVEQRCLTPKDIEAFLLGPSNRHYACTYPTRRFQAGRITLKGTCLGKTGQQVAVEGQGAYTATTFTLSATIATEIIGIPIAGRVRTDARRLGDDCPAPPP